MADDSAQTMAQSEVNYFDSYSKYFIHEDMLKDDVRTGSYMRAITENKHLFKDKVVLDVGCGTAILSMFAVQAGAKHVIGVDMSSIIDKAKELVEVNGMSDKITLCRGKMEEVQLPYEKVDIIVSEWMGYFLLYESMLGTVLSARDRYLKKDGLIFPDKATLYLAGVESKTSKENKAGYWDNFYGFDFSPLKHTALTEPIISVIESRSVVTKLSTILTLDLYTCTTADLSFAVPFELECNRTDLIHAFAAWFDIEYTACDKSPVTISTGPNAKPTHWKQTTFLLQDVLSVEQGEQIRGILKNKPNVISKRDLDIEISYQLSTKDPKRQAEGSCTYAGVYLNV